jgi:hypothetical protein
MLEGGGTRFLSFLHSSGASCYPALPGGEFPFAFGSWLNISRVRERCVAGPLEFEAARLSSLRLYAASRCQVFPRMRFR